MKKLFIGIGLLGGIGTLGYGLYKYYMVQIAKAMNYCYKIKSYKINNFSMTNLSMNLGVLFRNQSEFDLDIYGYNITVYINDVKTAVLKSNSKTAIAHNDTTLINMQVDVNPQIIFSDTKKLAQIILWSVTDTSKIIIRIEGTLSAGASFITVKDLPLKISMSMKEIMTDDPNAEICTVN